MRPPILVKKFQWKPGIWEHSAHLKALSGHFPPRIGNCEPDVPKGTKYDLMSFSDSVKESVFMTNLFGGLDYMNFLSFISEDHKGVIFYLQEWEGGLMLLRNQRNRKRNLWPRKQNPDSNFQVWHLNGFYTQNVNTVFNYTYIASHCKRAGGCEFCAVLKTRGLSPEGGWKIESLSREDCNCFTLGLGSRGTETWNRVSELSQEIMSRIGVYAV
jgi:hypothetical protein